MFFQAVVSNLSALPGMTTIAVQIVPCQLPTFPQQKVKHILSWSMALMGTGEFLALKQPATLFQVAQTKTPVTTMKMQQPMTVHVNMCLARVVWILPPVISIQLQQSMIVHVNTCHAMNLTWRSKFFYKDLMLIPPD